MKYKGSLGSRIFDVVNVVGLTLIMVVTLYPVIYVVLASVSDSNRLLAYTGLLVKPLGFNTAAYAAVIKNPNILSGYMVTIFVVVVGTILNILATSVSAFVLTRKRFPFRIPFTLMAVFTMYFSGGMIPRYLFINDTLGLGNTVWALILPGMISTYNMIIMKNNFESIPDSLEESARMDGANDIVILFKIVLPLSKAILAVMVLMYGVSHWNAWFDAMLFIRKRDLYPLQIILREILIANSTDSMMAGSGMSSDVEAIGESIKYATIVVATAPILCVYRLFKNTLLKVLCLVP